MCISIIMPILTRMVFSKRCAGGTPKTQTMSKDGAAVDALVSVACCDFQFSPPDSDVLSEGDSSADGAYFPLNSYLTITMDLASKC